MVTFISRLLLCFIFIPTMALSQLSYTESSNGFYNSPVLEGGRTELEFADINNDGNIDILSIGDHGSPYINTQEHGVMVWFGDGKGNWSVYQFGNFGYGGIAVGDVNWDGRWDVGYGMHHNYSGEDLGNDMLEVALGDGTGMSWTAWDDGLMPGGACWGMFSTDFADVDHDGDLDVGSCSFGYGVGLRVYRNLGNGNWQQTFSTPESINSSMEFYFRDVNRDGNPDIICATGGPAVYFGDGIGGFFPGDSGLPRSDYGLSGISPGDVENDGGCDVAFCNNQGGVEVWVWNESAGIWQSFSNGLPFSGGYQGSQLCDMNRDGFVDLCAVGGGHLTIWTGDGNGNWTQAVDIVLNPPGYYQAFRAGADFDHNGYPDFAMIIEEGNWPNEVNRAHAYKEATPPESLRIFPVFPRGGERFWNGSVQFVDWWSEATGAESSRARVEFSHTGPAGPWEVLADSLKNNGRFQWLVPTGVNSGNCYIRYTVTKGDKNHTAITPRPFFVGDPTGIAGEPFRGFQPKEVMISPNPTTGRAKIIFGEVLEAPTVLKVVDVSGRVVREIGVSGGKREIMFEPQGVGPGSYFLLRENKRWGKLVLQK